MEMITKAEKNIRARKEAEEAEYVNVVRANTSLSRKLANAKRDK